MWRFLAQAAGLLLASAVAASAVAWGLSEVGFLF